MRDRISHEFSALGPAASLLPPRILGSLIDGALSVLPLADSGNETHVPVLLPDPEVSFLGDSLFWGLLVSFQTSVLFVRIFRKSSAIYA